MGGELTGQTSNTSSFEDGIKMLIEGVASGEEDKVRREWRGQGEFFFRCMGKGGGGGLLFRERRGEVRKGI